MELAFPRLLAPKFLKAIKREQSWTRLRLGGDIMNRPHFFRMVQFNLGINYDWMSSRFSKNQVTLFELKYNKLLHTTPEFDATMAENYAIAQSFQDQFIPKLGYTYTYDRGFRHDRRHVTLQASVIDGGNLFSGIWGLAGANGQKTLFGTPFSQFIKGTVQLVYSHKISGDHKLVGRVYTGAAHAYGNSSEVPYTEQFYIGGANSLRAFAVRSIGPGSYHSDREANDGYYDQTGTFRFEMNLEYRFPIFGDLHGAAFLDAGNIWLIHEDPNRPGAQLKWGSFIKDLALGTGVGVRYDLDFIVVRVDCGIGLHVPYDTGKKGYYNIPKFKDGLGLHLAIGYPF
jgi:outer membrane translocation and assembly module TamA